MNKRIQQAAMALLRGAVATALGLSLGATMIASATSLADQPVFSTSSVPGNLALTLSVEWPTASRTAHTDDYSSAATFLGYFDPNKCYLYQSDATSNGVTAADKGDSSYFYPQGAANNRRCSNAWSGNFLNWASTPTIDPFRWAMTGGTRVVDTPGTTILQKAYHAGQGLFPDRLLTQSEIAGATPFSTATSLNVSIAGRGFMMQLTAGAPSTGRSFTGNFYQNNPYRTVGGTVVATVSNDSLDHIWTTNPAPGVNADYFSVTYTGTFTAPETGAYQFQTISDDGVRVFVNGTQVIDNWTDHGAATDTSGNVNLTSGQSFSVQVDFYQGNGGKQVQLFWKKPSTNSFNIFTSDSSVSNYTMRVKVCDPSLGVNLLEANCQAYGNNYKPEGLIQQYSDKMRFSAFGYLNDGSSTRDGGVLRAQQKFVGPTYPVPGALPAANSAQEWSSVDGTMTRNPDAADATTTTTDTGVTVSDSGVMNYLNKFGQLIPGGYKDYDPVNELYYAAMRYYRKLGNVPEWSDTSNTNDTNTRRKWIDGFPVIKTWNDPIQYACQRNFVLGIGDIYTWNDKNVAGNTRTDSEPTMPAKVSEDTTVNAMTATDRVGVMQGGMGANLSGAATGAGGSSYYMAGLALDANTKDIRPDLTGMQTVQTYWVDVLEQPFQTNNKFYLAAKFGGLNQKKLPAGFDPYTFAGTIPLDWWSTSGDKLMDTRTNVAVDRPDNYFAAGRPDTMLAGLTRAFQRISNEIDAYTTSFSLATVQVQSTGAASYGAQYDATTWTGVVSASEIVFDATGTPSSVTQKWVSSNTLETQLGGSGWDSSRRVVTWNGTGGVPFRTANLNSTQLGALDTPYVTGDDSSNYLNYLRGDRSKEKSNSDATKPYRQRSLLLGDIVDAKVTPVGPPNKTYSDAINPGYAAFKSAKATRPTMVYVGSNDGMLHAFNGAFTGASAGTEQFAYVPSAVITGPSGTPQVDGLAQLGSPNYDHRYYVDATAKAFDVDFNTTYGNFITTGAANSDWRSILIGGLGKGGRSFYAIDITDPGSMTTENAVAGKVLWEFTDSTMGFSFGTPNVIKTQKYGWVVVLTSGYNNTGGAGNSYLYFINPKTGALLEKVATGSTSDGMAQASAYVQDFSDNTADAIYAGDLNGQVWRFDVTAARGSSTPYPAGTRLAVVTDGSASANAQPITTPPLIEIQPKSRQRFVMFGTGQLLDAVDIGSRKEQSFYGILDGSATAFAPASATPIARSALTRVDSVLNGVTMDANSKGWYVDLGIDATTGIAWRIVNNSTTFSGIVSFAPLLTTGDACSPSGQSRLYALNFATGQTVLVPASTTAYISYPSALTDIKFLGVDGTARLVTGDVKAKLEKVDFTLPAGQGIRLLNWREVPTVD